MVDIICREVSSTLTTLERIPDTFNSFDVFRSLNISTLTIFTNVYEEMNPFYNSYQDTLSYIKDYSSLTNYIHTLLKTICIYLKLPYCLDNLSIEMKQALNDRVQALLNCFLQSNCSNIIDGTGKINAFYFKDVLNNMKENFSFLQPILHQSDVKNYINNHFLYASSYIHDILLNFMAVRTMNTSKAACEETENVFQLKLYQTSTETRLHVSINSINLMRNIDDSIDDRILSISNSNEPELLVYMNSDTRRDIMMFICGIVHLIYGFTLMYFLKNLLSVIFNQEG